MYKIVHFVAKTFNLDCVGDVHFSRFIKHYVTKIVWKAIRFEKKNAFTKIENNNVNASVQRVCRGYMLFR